MSDSGAAKTNDGSSPEDQQHSLSPENFSRYVPQLLELVNDLVFAFTPDGQQIQYLNQAGERIFGRAIEQFPGGPGGWIDSIHEEDRAKLLGCVPKIDASPQFELGFRIIQPSGKIRHLRGTFWLVRDDRNRTLAVGCVAKDITNRVRAETELQEAKAIYHSLVESLPINVFRKDREGRLVFVNKKCCETFGQTREQLLGKTDEDLFDAELAEKYRKNDKWVLQTGLPFHDIEFHPNEDNSYIYVEVLKAPVTSASGRRIGIQGMFWDVTERKNAEIALEKARDIAEQASQAKSDFLANVSHEIRTPLNAVIGMTDLLLGSQVDTPQRDYLEMIQDSGQSLLTLINDILDFSKIESGKLSLENDWFDLRELLGDTLRSLAHRAHERHLDLICNIDPEIPSQVLGDSLRLRQVMVNLVSNAIKFTQQGDISVNVEKLGTDNDTIQLRFLIEDTGIGIPEQKLSEIFEEFVQVDTSSTRQFGGTGLGLAISSRLVGMMGGELGVSSVVGSGSQFFFEVPFPVGANPTLPASADELVDVPAMIVASNPTTRESLETTLKSWRMKTYCVANSEQAIKLAQGMKFADQPIRIVLAESEPVSGSDGGRCSLTELASQLDSDRDAMPKFIALVKAARDNATRRPPEALIAGSLILPAKHSELLQTIVKCIRETAEQPGDPTSVEVRSAGPWRILLAEDNPVNQKLALGILKKQGHEVQVAQNGSEAVAAVAEANFDAVLMDVQMPVMDGLEATRAIRASENPSASRVPIIAMTAHALPADRQRCLEAGMDDYLSKPFKAADLIEKLGAHASSRSAELQREETNGRAGSDTIVDWNRAFQTVGGDRRLLTELIQVFLSDRDRMFNELQSAIENSVPHEIRRTAHSLKGALNHLGAARIAEIAESIESTHQNDSGSVAGLCEQLKNRLIQLTEELERFRNTG